MVEYEHWWIYYHILRHNRPAELSGQEVWISCKGELGHNLYLNYYIGTKDEC